MRLNLGKLAPHASPTAARERVHPLCACIELRIELYYSILTARAMSILTILCDRVDVTVAGRPDRLAGIPGGVKSCGAHLVEGRTV